MKGQDYACYVEAFESIYNKLERKWHKQTFHILDNECLRAVNHFLQKRRNPTNNLLKPTTIWSTRVNQPSNPQSITQLTIFQPSIRTAQSNFGANVFPRSRSPSTSYKPRGWIHQNQHTMHSTARTPRAPVGSKTLRFLPPIVRNTFQSHVIDTWYVDPSMEHYRKMMFNNPLTGYNTNSGTYILFPAHTKVPTISEGDHTIMTATDLLKNSRKCYQLVQVRNKTIAKYYVHWPMFLPSTKCQGRTGGSLSKWITCHLRGWTQHQIRGWAKGQPHLLTQWYQRPSAQPPVFTNKK